MIGIIVALIVALIVIVVVINAMQQHKEKQEAEKRALAGKQKAIIDETEELILSMGNLPPNPPIIEILNRRSLNAAKKMLQIIPSGTVKSRVNDFESRLKASVELNQNNPVGEEMFILPDNEQHLVAILQTIKKLRIILKSEQAKGTLDAQTFMREDLRFDAMQLKISIESLVKRGNIACEKEMLGSARGYFEKALATLNKHAHKSEYTQTKEEEIHDRLEEITAMLKTTNAADREKKAKSEEDDLDMLFQPKKKW
jgi:predicted RND superfamily exporter protein